MKPTQLARRIRQLAMTPILTLLLAAAASAQTERVEVIFDGDPIKYFKGVEDPPPDWTTFDFDDSGWTDGVLPIGYGDLGTDPNLPNGTSLPDMIGSYLTVYVRIHFMIDEPRRLTRLDILARYDDAFAVHLNGMELARANLPTGALNRNTPASADHEYNTAPFSRAIQPAVFADIVRKGENVACVEVHNVNLTSSDLVFQPGVPPSIKGLFRLSLAEAPKPEFVRGAECDGASALDIGDPIYFLRWQFGGFYAEPGCVKACDTNDDGVLNLTDAVYGLNYLFMGGPAFPEPYPATGTDPTDDELTCESGLPPL